MKAYLINLDRRPDRLKLMSAKLNEMGLSFVRVPAFDGMAYAVSVKKWEYSLRPAEFGCLMSHVHCLTMIANGNDEYGIVLEDDLIFSSDAGRYLTDTTWLPKKADVIKFETCGMHVHVEKIISPKQGEVSYGRLKSDHLGAAGYIITKTAAQRLLTLLGGYDKPIDVALFCLNGGFLNNFVVYQTIPALCCQSGLDSTINHDHAIWEKSHSWSVGAVNIKKNISIWRRIIREILRPYKRYQYKKNSMYIELKE